MQKEVHVDPTEYCPVVQGIFNEIENGHGVIRETMKEHSFEFPFKKMSDA
jgi:hypothetical protein